MVQINIEKKNVNLYHGALFRHSHFKLPEERSQVVIKSHLNHFRKSFIVIFSRIYSSIKSTNVTVFGHMSSEERVLRVAGLSQRICNLQTIVVACHDAARH